MRISRNSGRVLTAVLTAFAVFAFAFGFGWVARRIAIDTERSTTMRFIWIVFGLAILVYVLFAVRNRRDIYRRSPSARLSDALAELQADFLKKTTPAGHSPAGVAKKDSVAVPTSPARPDGSPPPLPPPLPRAATPPEPPVEPK